MPDSHPESEKPPRTLTRTSSHGDSTDDTGYAGQPKSEGHAVGTPPEDMAKLAKLDSKVIKVPTEEDDPFRHLPPAEAEVLKRQVHIPEVKSGYLLLFRYATLNDKLIIAVSSFCSIAGGAMLPLMTVRGSLLANEYWLLNATRSFLVNSLVLSTTTSKGRSAKTTSMVSL